MSRWGPVESLEIVYEERSKKHKGYGFVKFKNLETTKHVLRDTGKYALHGKKVVFNLAKGRIGE